MASSNVRIEILEKIFDKKTEGFQTYALENTGY
jgi:hypothetical protein